MICRVLFAIAMIGFPFQALANDTIANITQSGIELLKTDHISMKSEHLYLSPTKVRVEYEFYNHSENDIVTQVAFPMPSIHIDASYHSANFDFLVWVDGKKVAYQSVGRAVQESENDTAKDITAQVNAFSLPMDRFLEAKEIAPKTLEQLIAKGLYSDQNIDEEMAAAYRLHPIYYWQQTFPSHKITKVVHEYEPQPGSNSLGTSNFEDRWKSNYPDFLKTNDCYAYSESPEQGVCMILYKQAGFSQTPIGRRI